jgi:Origin recognition complex (ORC) subunit 5 C-terminus
VSSHHLHHLSQVLKTKKLLPLIIGRGIWQRSSQPFVEKAIDGFLIALVQFLSDISMDINEFVRVGRSLWPVYLQALAPTTITETLRSLDVDVNDEETPSKKLDCEVLGLLSRRFFRTVGKISKILTTLPMDSTGSVPILPGRCFEVSDLELPFLRKCLLLAAFICQKNRAENDKKVFSVQGNGRRRKSRKHETNDEDTAFASAGNGMEKLQSLRPRPFLVERVFSIFVTLVRLNPDSSPSVPGTERAEYSADSLGTTRLYDDFRSLIDLGFIHEAASGGGDSKEKVNFNAPKFWCSLTDQEASDLAKSTGIPLANYLV